jgi:SAM-dependent methyltransferase
VAKNNYDSVSLIYDNLMRTVRYDYWADYIYDISSKYIDTKSKVLELGSGNCKLAAFLKKKYKNIIATDLSFQMLRLNKKITLPKICCNMTRLPFNTKFDLIISTFDSVNYLLYKKDLMNLFKGISTVLSEHGIFTFDVSMEKNSITHSVYPDRVGKVEQIKFTQKSQFNNKNKIHRNIFEIQLANGEKITEIHKERIYSFNDYFILIEKAGLFVTECLEAFSFKDGTRYSKRLQFIVKKAG